jgi:hypothetical protein
VIFDENDKDKMTPDEFAKSRTVIEAQIESRKRHLAEAAEKHNLGI